MVAISGFEIISLMSVVMHSEHREGNPWIVSGTPPQLLQGRTDLDVIVVVPGNPVRSEIQY